MSPSSRIELAAGTITPSGDTLQIELIRPVGNPPAVLIISPAAPSVTNTNPKAIAKRSDRGSPGIWRGAGATRKALTSEG